MDMSILEQIGNTPLLKLEKVTEELDADIYIKCEFLNPGGSIKDRMALCMIEEAEKSGRLRPGGTIVDQSTGNTGPALAFVGAVKGYKVQLFLPAQLSSSYNPADRIRIAYLFGCTVTPVDLEDHIKNIDQLNRVEKAASFVAIRMKQCYDMQENDPYVWWANQLCNPDNANAHRDGTGVEILEQMNGKVDAETLKVENPDLTIAGVLPTDDPRLEWVRSRAVHMALKKFNVPEQRFLIEEILEKNLLDEEIIVKNEDAKNMADRLCQEEGLFCGMSSGANVFAAIELGKKMKKGSRIVTVLVDRRDRYFAEYPHEHYVV